MYRILFIATVICVTSLAAKGAITIGVQSAGDGHFHDELGSSYDFFDAGANPNCVHYSFYGTSDTMSKFISYAQFNLSPLVGQSVESVTLNICFLGAYKEAATASAGSIKHVSNSSNANGNASQKLSGNELVATIMPGASGWTSFDVTDYIKNDLAQGYTWAAFSFNEDAGGDYWNRNAGFSFASAESGNGAYLQAVVPEPGSFALLAVAAGALLRRRP